MTYNDLLKALQGCTEIQLENEVVIVDTVNNKWFSTLGIITKTYNHATLEKDSCPHIDIKPYIK